MSRLFLLIFCVSVASSLDCDGSQHNAQFGKRSKDDMLDFVDHIKEDYKFLRVIEKTVMYPPANQKSTTKLINYIEIIDQFTNGNGGCATLLTGGPGFNSTTIKLTSKRNHGLDFTIRIFVKQYI